MVSFELDELCVPTDSRGRLWPDRDDPTIDDRDTFIRDHLTTLHIEVVATPDHRFRALCREPRGHPRPEEEEESGEDQPPDPVIHGVTPSSSSIVAREGGR